MAPKAQTRKRKQPRKLPTVTALQPLDRVAAGIDVGAAEVWVAVPTEAATPAVRVFATFTSDLHAAADWLGACGVTTVAMESTGIYWLPLYEILEARGLDVQLVHAAQTKHVTGRKSDLLDCQWIQQLHSYGLLRASFRPSEEICTLRSLVRHRTTLLQGRAVQIQHMQKALHLMNLQLTNVLRDITGQTGLQILRAIVAGERDPQVLARFRDRRCAKSASEIAKSLTGHYKSEHVFALQQALELYDVYNQKVAACDEQIAACCASFAPQVDVQQHPLPPPARERRSKNSPPFDLRTHLYQLAGVDLTAIDGIDALGAQTLLAEIGLDMSPWPTVKHFASWLGLAPQHNSSGGKLLSSRTKKTQNRAAAVLRLAALSVNRSDSALGAFYRRIRSKHGAPKAITATAHKLARIVYTMLKTRTPYHDPGAAYYEEHYQQRLVNNLTRKAKKLGLQLVPLSEGATTAT
jgi:transposase